MHEVDRAVGFGGRTGLEVGADHRLGDPSIPGGGEDFRHLAGRQCRDFGRLAGHIFNPVATAPGITLLRRDNTGFPLIAGIFQLTKLVTCSFQDWVLPCKVRPPLQNNI